ncbi:uncharacterized protein LOC108631798 [Ceratina calcarata]|uniref:Uncharacterized protein LOC108631798 n=1 Tax=Ceratina calcarata TaxID=156304 RepID=A0AAJ7WFY1_9HYME|nr:uncharacterized protein LOC108631798 [Ceratina calcarata]
MKCDSSSWFAITCSILLVIFYNFPERTRAETFDNRTFVEKCLADCDSQKDFTTCGKYRLARWLEDVAREKEFNYGPIRIVRIPSMVHQPVLPKLPQLRVFKSGAIETLNFLRDIFEDLITKRALVYTVENPVSSRSFGTVPMVMDEDEFTQLQTRKKPDDEWRIFKKKKSLIIPILILLNLLKLKLLLLPIFLGVHFIKKLLVLGSLVLPSILAHLKICKVPQPHQQPQPHHMWATAAEAPVDYPSTGYGQQDEAWAHRNDYHAGLPYMNYYGYRNPYG